jgi:hypothetical protein
MTSRRWLGLGALVVVVAVIWIAVAATGSDDADAPPSDRPDRLLDLRPADIIAVEANGHVVPLDQVRDDLAPLLVIRRITRVDPTYGLDPPWVTVLVHTRDRSYELGIGRYNFDETAVYARVGNKVGTILIRLADRLASAAGVTLLGQD